MATSCYFLSLWSYFLWAPSCKFWIHWSQLYSVICLLHCLRFMNSVTLPQEGIAAPKQVTQRAWGMSDHRASKTLLDKNMLTWSSVGNSPALSLRLDQMFSRCPFQPTPLGLCSIICFSKFHSTFTFSASSSVGWDQI